MVELAQRVESFEIEPSEAKQQEIVVDILIRRVETVDVTSTPGCKRPPCHGESLKDNEGGQGGLPTRPKKGLQSSEEAGHDLEGSETSCLGTPGETTRPSHTFNTRHCGDFNLRSGEAGGIGKPMGWMGT
jgi:hypothetical protein